MFNSDIYSKQEISETATAKNISLQNVYDSLYPFALHYSMYWEFGIKLISEITQIPVNCSMKFGKDFHFDTDTDMITQLKMLKDAGASTELIKLQEYKLIKSRLEDNVEELKRYHIKDYFTPWTSKSEAMIISIKTTLPPDNYFKVLFNNFDEIFNAIELKYPTFYDMERDKQQKIVDEMVIEFTIKYVKPIEQPIIKPPVL
jgi:hypothetical protein